MSILVLCVSFPLSTIFVLWTLWTLPMSISFPHTLSDLNQLARDLHGYAQTDPWAMLHVLGVLGITASYQHAWSLVGSVIANVLAGTLVDPITATLYMSMITTLGSLFATLLAVPLAPFFNKLFPKTMIMTRDALSPPANAGEHQPPWARLAILRLSSLFPWSLLNIASGILAIPLPSVTLATFIGVLPWTAVTCHLGSILVAVIKTGEADSAATVGQLLVSRGVVARLAVLTALGLVPVLGRGWFAKLLSAGHNPESVELNEKRSTAAA